MSASCLEWLLPEQQDPIAKLASRILKGFPTTIPVDIFALTEPYASVDFVDWAYDCDALVHGLNTPRPEILLRTLDRVFDRRLRMTLGHELGHIYIPWHIGSITCDGMTEILETPAAALGTPYSFRGQEGEATAFSSLVLMPYRALAQDANTKTLSAFFSGLDRYGVSAQATVIRIKTLLRPGFIFRGDYDYGGSITEEASNGTRMPISSLHRTEQLKEAAYESGTFTIGRKRIAWYRVAEIEDFQPVDDPRTTTQLLRAAVSVMTDGGSPSDKVIASVNGVVSGALSKVRFRTESEALSHVRQWTLHHSSIPPEIRSRGEFDMYLKRKVQERLTKLRASGTL